MSRFLMNSHVRASTSRAAQSRATRSAPSPAEGPACHEAATGVPQPVWAGHSSTLKELIYALEGEARDTFPSGHAIIAAITIVVCFRNRLWGPSLAAVPLSLAVIASTLYLRYHYLIDVLVGLAVAGLCCVVGVAWHRRHARAGEMSP